MCTKEELRSHFSGMLKSQCHGMTGIASDTSLY